MKGSFKLMRESINLNDDLSKIVYICTPQKESGVVAQLVRAQDS
jgi:hypothetical protein